MPFFAALVNCSTVLLSLDPLLWKRVSREWRKPRNEAIFKMEAGTKHGFNLRVSRGDVKGQDGKGKSVFTCKNKLSLRFYKVAPRSFPPMSSRHKRGGGGGGMVHG